MKPRIQWGRLLRRSLALFLATLAVWALLVCSGGGSAANAFRSLGQDPGFVSAALSAELGQVAEDDGPLSGLSGWARLVVDQSPLLRGNGDAVAGHLDGSAPATPDLPAGQPPRITTTSASRLPRPLPRRRTSLPAPWFPPAPRAMRCPGACTSTTAPGWTWIWPPPQQPP